VGNDIRQSLNAMQMWRAKSSTVSYSDMKQGAYPACVYTSVHGVWPLWHTCSPKIVIDAAGVYNQSLHAYQTDALPGFMMKSVV
jgi:hypothetical protein